MSRIDESHDTAYADTPNPIRSLYPSWTSVSGHVIGAYIVISVILIGVGRLLVGPLNTSPLVRWDEQTVTWFAERRSPGLTSVSSWLSRLADAPTIVAIALVAATVFAFRRKWHEVAYLGAALIVELATFLTISYAVGRERPTAPHIGSVPSTASFPSGHIAAAIVLFGLLAVLLRRLTASGRAGRGGGICVAADTLAVLAAAGVGWARVYRGMHHPLDVMAGAVMGVAVLTTFVVATRNRPIATLKQSPTTTGPSRREASKERGHERPNSETCYP